MKLKKTLAVLLTLCMLLSVLGAAAFAEPSAETEIVSYIDANGEETSVEATVLGPGGGNYGAEGETGWYVLKDRVTCTTNISFRDAVVNVILADDADWTINTSTLCALNLFSGDLNVYAQKEGTGAISTNQRFGANYGNLHIYGGNIDADDGLHADPSSGKSVTIDGGLVRAGSLTTKDFIVNGGDTVLQSNYPSGDVTITGGAFECHGSSSGIQAPTGKVSISGGYVYVSGTQNGIYAKELSITGGDVTAYGGSTMGIMAKSTIINGGKVDLNGGLFSIYSSGTDPVLLGCPTADASIQLRAGLNPENTYAIVEGQTLTDGENNYAGTLTAQQAASLTGKTLTAAVTYTPVAAKTPTVDENGNIAYYEGSDGKLYVKNGDAYVETSETAVLVPYFEFSDEGTQLSGYNGADAEIVLPEVIPDNYPDEALRGKSYGIVKDYAFYENTIVTKVTMQDNIYHIGEGAFEDCANLEEVYIGENLEMIQNVAFDGCDSLKKVYCTSPIGYNQDQGHYNWSGFNDTDALKVYCVKNSILDDARYYDNTYFIYLPLSEEKDATCTEDGNIAYYEGVQNEEPLYFDADGAPIAYEDILIPGGHVYGEDDWTDATFADCGNDGNIGYFTCTRCGQRFDPEGNFLTDDDIVVPATGDHDWTWVTDEEPGCYTDGAKHEYCTVCEQTQSEGTAIPAAHEFDAWTPAVAPTCGADGTVGYKRCHVCGDNFDADGNKLDSIVDPATGNHTIALVNAKEATETEAGYTGDEVCTVCGQTIKQGGVIPATGETTHDEPDGSGDCPFCGKHHTKLRIIIGHLILAFFRDVFRMIKK